MSYIGNQPTQAAFVTDSFSGTGSTTVFTMSVAPANTASVLVIVSGVVQDPSTYSVSGLTLTFSAAPPSGTANISVRYLGIPASGVTTTAYRTKTEFTATAGQTTFTPASYTAGYIDVFRNGVLLGSADYTAINGTTVVLTTGATAGDLVTTESFYVSSVLNAIPNTPNAVVQSNIAPLSHTMTVLTSGSGTYTVPAGVRALLVEMVGGGGGGQASNSAGAPNGGGSGTSTTFGSSFLTCGAGNGGQYGGAGGGTGGTSSIGAGATGLALVGGTGTTPGVGNGTSLVPYLTGGAGGTNPFGGSGGGSWGTAAGVTGAANTGAGGGGAGSNSTAGTGVIAGAGGGAGGYIKALIASPAASYSYSVGTGGAGGTAGTNGFNGGAGGSGLIMITEYYI